MDEKQPSKQITMFVPEATLREVDEAARAESGKNNYRTQWILDAINKKLGTAPEDVRAVEIAAAFASLDEDGKEWLHKAAIAARNGLK